MSSVQSRLAIAAGKALLARLHELAGYPGVSRTSCSSAELKGSARALGAATTAVTTTNTAAPTEKSAHQLPLPKCSPKNAKTRRHASSVAASSYPNPVMRMRPWGPGSLLAKLCPTSG